MTRVNSIVLALFCCLFSIQVKALPPHVKKGISGIQLQNVQLVSQNVLRARDAMDKVKVSQELRETLKELKQSLPKQPTLVTDKHSSTVKGKKELLKPGDNTQTINQNRIRDIVKTMRKSRKLAQANNQLNTGSRQARIIDAALRKVKKIEQEIDAALLLDAEAQFSQLAVIRNRLERTSYNYDPGNQTPMLTTKAIKEIPVAKSRAK